MKAVIDANYRKGRGGRDSTIAMLQPCLRECTKVDFMSLKSKKIYGIGRSRDKKGRIVATHLLPYTMCLHTQMGGGRVNMMVLIAEENEQQIGEAIEE